MRLIAEPAGVGCKTVDAYRLAETAKMLRQVPLRAANTRKRGAASLAASGRKPVLDQSASRQLPGWCSTA
jgi:hypothetical protein